jgi:hypothetical protein
MDVSVLYKRAQRWLHGVARPAVFGNGMLERARATSLALLGFTAAVGLAIVALAANQGWPLIAGSSIPTIPPRHAAVGPGVAVAGLEAPVAHPKAAPARARKRDAVERSGGATPAPPAPAPSSELVVSPAAPAPPQGGDSPAVHKPSPTPAAQPTQPTAETPTTAPAPAPSTPPAPPVESAPPTATSSEAPPESESHVPSWSHGRGHAYGRSGDEEGDD